MSMSNSQESDQKRFFLPCSMPRNGKRGTWPLMSKSITQENTVKKRFRVTITGKAHFLQKKKKCLISYFAIYIQAIVGILLCSSENKTSKFLYFLASTSLC